MSSQNKSAMVQTAATFFLEKFLRSTTLESLWSAEIASQGSKENTKTSSWASLLSTFAAYFCLAKLGEFHALDAAHPVLMTQNEVTKLHVRDFHDVAGSSGLQRVVHYLVASEQQPRITADHISKLEAAILVLYIGMRCGWPAVMAGTINSVISKVFVRFPPSTMPWPASLRRHTYYLLRVARARVEQPGIQAFLVDVMHEHWFFACNAFVEKCDLSDI
jgi:hypothetical protein